MIGSDRLATVGLGNQGEGYLANDRLCFRSVAFREDWIFAAAAHADCIVRIEHASAGRIE